LLIPSGNAEATRHYEITRKGERYLQVFTEIEDDLRPAKPY
jgi:predicted transcriptional regulator